MSTKCGSTPDWPWHQGHGSSRERERGCAFRLLPTIVFPPPTGAMVADRGGLRRSKRTFERKVVRPSTEEETTMDTTIIAARRALWNKGKLVGRKAPLKVKDIWAIRVRLQLQGRIRELALLDLGIDSKLRGCDLVKLHVRDVCHGGRVSSRAIVLQQ